MLTQQLQRCGWFTWPGYWSLLSPGIPAYPRQNVLGQTHLVFTDATLLWLAPHTGRNCDLPARPRQMRALMTQELILEFKRRDKLSRAPRHKVRMKSAGLRSCSLGLAAVSTGSMSACGSFFRLEPLDMKCPFWRAGVEWNLEICLMWSKSDLKYPRKPWRSNLPMVCTTGKSCPAVARLAFGAG